MKAMKRARRPSDSDPSRSSASPLSRVYLVLCILLIAVAGLLLGRYSATAAPPEALPSGLGSIPPALTAPSPGSPATGSIEAATNASPEPQAAEEVAPSPPPTASPAESPAPFTMEPSPPSSIKASTVGITSSLGQVGLNPDGTIEVPTDYAQAAWYQLGPTPGELGPAVILGHVDSHKGPAVFYNLSSLRPGQTIDVTREDKTVAHFRVDGINTYRRDQFPTQAVYGPINYAGLRLITCGGAYDQKAKAYESNVVVFATLIRT